MSIIIFITCDISNLVIIISTGDQEYTGDTASLPRGKVRGGCLKKNCLKYNQLDGEALAET